MKKWMNIVNIVESYAPDYLYHGTSKRHLKSILEDGLLAPSYWGEIGIARDYMIQHGADGIVLRKPIGAFSEDGLGVNETLASIMSQDDDEFEVPETWEESLEQCESVVYHYIMRVDEEDIHDL